MLELHNAGALIGHESPLVTSFCGAPQLQNGFVLDSFTVPQPDAVLALLGK